eukprot:TRINITY_DN4544_c0_g1_i2.p1 TRINITY_DN4544_c0_g1~~TRINITY_DN4544_c0_g1_i2.p1  ORF type:complete len:782 (-),score=211.80 TRINITY_DN4544_c0_g1_i2:3-2348(-)
MADTKALLLGIGLDDKKAAETLKNKDLSSNLEAIIREAGADAGCDKAAGAILYSLATKYPANASKYRPYLAKLVVAKKVTSNNLQATLDYLKKVGNGELNEDNFYSECGVGVVVSHEQIAEAVRHLLREKDAELKEKRYRINIGVLLSALRNNPVTKWADGKILNEELNEQIKSILGPRTAEDDKPLEKKKEAPKEDKKKEEKPKDSEKDEEPEFVVPQESIRFPDPTENIQNNPKTLEDHLNRTGKRIYTRFPPEPNGYLHIGHAKSMNLNFGYAKKHNGVCYLRFDDTNPEKEEHEYFNSIIDSVKWLGWQPWKITYSSHYFPQLYTLALDLIRRGKAYVCHETKEEMKEGRASGRPSRFRDRSVEENLKLFDDMRKGKYDEGTAVLRMKGDMQNPNPNMRDLVAYRIKYTPHPISGSDWCVYPSYDYTHCLVDSIEDITHSLCTLEFETRRESYNWLIDVLDLYRPVVWEYSRLNLSNTVLSKRKLIRLVKEGYVRGWDDPRMSTLNGFRRKGYTAAAINNFCEGIGVTRAPNMIPYSLLEHYLRLDLDPRSHRAFAVLNPVKVTITNLPADHYEQITIANHPYNDLGTHVVPFTNTLYIERSDFRTKDEKGYYGLAPEKEVILKYAYSIKCTSFNQDASGNVSEIFVTVDKTNPNKVKGVLHWVAESKKDKSPLKVEIRLYESLFNSEDINDLGNDWLADLNPNSLTVVDGALADVSLAGAAVWNKYQFERQGFFVVDPDTTADKIVFNRSVTLKESKSKKTIAPTAAKAAPKSKAK